MNTVKRALALAAALLLLAGCGAKTTPKEGVVYLDPNKAPAATAAPAEAETKPVEAVTETTAQGGAEEALDLHFEYRGVIMAPMMEAAPVLAALGDPLRYFEADSCAYQSKDLFYAYPGVELTVNDAEGAERITAIHLTDDTIVTPQGLRVYDEEAKLLDLLGGQGTEGVYSYRSGRTLLLIEVKDTENGRRIWSMEYRAADEGDL